MKTDNPDHPVKSTPKSPVSPDRSHSFNKKFLFLIIPMLIIAVIILINRPAFQWYYDYHKGMTLAREQKKAVLLLFTLSDAKQGLLMKGCCELPEIEPIIAENFIAIILYGDKNKMLVDQYKITTIPTIILTWPDDPREVRAVGNVKGYRLLPKFEEFLELNKTSSENQDNPF